MPFINHNTSYFKTLSFSSIICIALCFALLNACICPVQAQKPDLIVPEDPQRLLIIRFFLRVDDLTAVYATKDVLPLLFASGKSHTEYFRGTTSTVNVFNAGKFVRSGDLRALSFDLVDYGVRAQTTNRNKIGVSSDTAPEAFNTAADVLILPTNLKPAAFIEVEGEDERKTQELGVHRYIYTILPISSGVERIRSGLRKIDNSPNSPLSKSIDRTIGIQKIIRAYALKQLVLIEKAGFGESKVENSDTRAYAKLFEEELPILRRELTLLKADIDKGFAELQKQQDARNAAAQKKTP